MSYVGRITTGHAPSVTRQPALGKLALVIAFVVAIAAATVLIVMGSGAGTQSNVASDGPRNNSPSPFPGLSEQAERAVPGKSSAEANYVNPSTGYPSATSRPESPGTRVDGGPEEGTRGVVPARQPNISPGSRYDGGPEEGTSSAREQDLRHLRAGGDTPTRAVPGIRYDGGPEEGTSGFGH
jgi:hypothetical protein